MTQTTSNLCVLVTLFCVIATLALRVTADVTSPTPVTTTDAKTRSFVAAIESCSPDCQLQIGECLNGAPGAQALWQAERYCDLLNYKEKGTNSYDCLVKTKYCTVAEYKKLEHAACGAYVVFGDFLAIVTCLLTFLFRWNLGIS